MLSRWLQFSDGLNHLGWVACQGRARFALSLLKLQGRAHLRCLKMDLWLNLCLRKQGHQSPSRFLRYRRIVLSIAALFFKDVDQGCLDLRLSQSSKYSSLKCFTRGREQFISFYQRPLWWSFYGFWLCKLISLSVEIGRQFARCPKILKLNAF